MKKIIIAPDSYKGSLSALEVAKGLEQGIKRVISQVEIIKAPLADGGEGTVDALLSNLRGIYQEVQVLDPLGREIRASYGIINGDTAIIEMAAASGLPLLKREELNPLKASTYGTGQLIRDALDRGIRRIYLGLGGSATNDGGAGMVQALGFSFRDKEGKEIGPGGGELGRIEEIDASGKYGLLQEAEIIILSDVTNPLCGINGASYIFAGQKGASQEEIKILDNNLRHMGEKIKEYLDIDVIEIPGSGAAGGLGAVPERR